MDTNIGWELKINKNSEKKTPALACLIGQLFGCHSNTSLSLLFVFMKDIKHELEFLLVLSCYEWVWDVGGGKEKKKKKKDEPW